MTYLLQPKLQIFSQGEQIVVLFDSNSPEDEMRSTCALKIASTFDRITAVVTGFEDSRAITPSTDDEQTYEGAVELEVHAPGTTDPTRHKLASLRLVLPPVRPRRRSAAPRSAPAEELRNSVQQGVANAMSDALSEWLFTQQHSHQPAGEGVLLQRTAEPGSYPALRSVPSFSARAASDRQQDAPRAQRRRIAMVALSVPLVALVVFLGAGAALRNPVSPIEEAVAKSLSDPNGATAQVELTRATLAQMGLDPGKSADLGCLAAPAR